MTINYVSLFSGIGCFEYAIHSMFPKAKCLGFSEIDPYAIKVYKEHYPTHNNLGDITKIKENQIQTLLSTHKCHIIVAGFPCQDLSSLARVYGEGKGLKGKKSKLFFQLLKILKWVWKYNRIVPMVIIENNSSMDSKNRILITDILQQLDCNFNYKSIDNALFGVQRRKRLFWINFILSDINESMLPSIQKWKDILLRSNDKRLTYVSRRHIEIFNKTYSVNSSMISYIARPINDKLYGFYYTGKKGERSRWQMNTHSDTSNEHSIPITRTLNYIIVRDRVNPDLFRVRKIHAVEIERLFFLPDGYVSDYLSQSRCEKLLGNGISIAVIQFILNRLKYEYSKRKYA